QEQAGALPRPFARAGGRPGGCRSGGNRGVRALGGPADAGLLPGPRRAERPLRRELRGPDRHGPRPLLGEGVSMARFAGAAGALRGPPLVAGRPVPRREAGPSHRGGGPTWRGGALRTLWLPVGGVRGG